LLRIYGHGTPAKQNLSTAKGGHRLDRIPTCRDGTIIRNRLNGRRSCEYSISNGQGMALGNFDLVKRHLAPLRGCFGPLGSLELHGCDLAKGSKGNLLLFRLAFLLGVPVTAAMGRNTANTQRQILRVERPRQTWFPSVFVDDVVRWAKAGAKKAAATSKRAAPVHAGPSG
jgi:hypothetical protein